MLEFQLKVRPFPLAALEPASKHNLLTVLAITKEHLQYVPHSYRFLRLYSFLPHKKYIFIQMYYIGGKLIVLQFLKHYILLYLIGVGYISAVYTYIIWKVAEAIIFPTRDKTSWIAISGPLESSSSPITSNINPATMQQTPATIWQNDKIGRLPQHSITNKPNKYPVERKNKLMFEYPTKFLEFS